MNMANYTLYDKLADKYNIPANAVEELAAELEKNGGLSVHFDIEALGGRGLWKINQRASVGNGFNQQLNV